MKTKPKHDELMSLSQAAETYGFSGDYFRRLAEKGRLGARKIGRQWLTTADAVESFLESREERGVYKKQIKKTK
jgi:excisionase family DNA binding protein